MEINNENYKEVFKDGIHIIEIAGDQCAGCVALNPIVVDLAKKFHIKNHYVNITHTNYKFIEEFEVQKVPTLLLLSNGKLIDKVSGYQPPEILELWLEDKIDKINK